MNSSAEKISKYAGKKYKRGLQISKRGLNVSNVWSNIRAMFGQISVGYMVKHQRDVWSNFYHVSATFINL